MKANHSEKRSKLDPTLDFLSLGAKRAKERKARAGSKRSKADKLSNTGSGLPLKQVARLKYVKGFTQAVRTPCLIEELI